ncbi:MAG: Cna B-type domain-containing protein [Firmicutes bacterium]|nr:Cna B-type domain-containing protein [Bacillota bacterium]
MKMPRIAKAAMGLFALIFCLLLGNMTAFAASNTAEVKIPVSCTGADCTAVLLNADGTEMQRLSLTAGQTAQLTLTCKGALPQSFTLQLNNTDTNRVTYDKTAYGIRVSLDAGGNAVAGYTIEAGSTGNAPSGKLTEPVFHNTVRPADPSSIHITVNKLWVDDGDHPDSVTVNLMCAGNIAGTAVLNEGNGWSHTFTELSPAYSYTVVEADPPENYTALVAWQGDVFIITNVKEGKPVPVLDNPALKVSKTIDGQPQGNAAFAFVLRAKDPAYPMPAGSQNGVKETSITGRGEGEFGVITFTKPGVYTYTVTETDTGEKGYTYDGSVYTIQYAVTERNGRLVSVRSIFKDGKRMPDMTIPVFQNKYRQDGTENPPQAGSTLTVSKAENPQDAATPPTGDESHARLWLSLMFLALAGLGLTLIALAAGKRKAAK